MNTALQFETVLARRGAIQQRIDRISTQLGHAPSLGVLAAQAGEEHQRLKGYLQQCGGEGNMGNQQKQNLRLYRQRHETAERLYLEAKAFQEPLRAELTELQAELAEMDCTCSLQELLSIQEEQVLVENEAERIRQAVADQEQKKVSAWEAVPSIDALIEKRQELLAQKEIGEDVEADLVTVEQELEHGKQTVQEARTRAERGGSTCLNKIF